MGPCQSKKDDSNSQMNALDFNIFKYIDNHGR